MLYNCIGHSTSYIITITIFNSLEIQETIDIALLHYDGFCVINSVRKYLSATNRVSKKIFSQDVCMLTTESRRKSFNSLHSMLLHLCNTLSPSLRESKVVVDQ